MGDVGHEFLSPLLVAVLLRHIVEDDEHAAAELVGKGRQIKLQRPLTNHQLALGVVGPLERQHVLEGIDGAEQLGIRAGAVHIAVEHGVGGGIPVDEMSLPVKGHHAVGHVEKEGVQLVSLVFHSGQRALQHTGHLVERAGEDSDLIGGFHRQRAVKVSGGHLLRACGELFDGAHHGFG